MRALVKLPNPVELIRREALPAELKEMAFKFANGGIEVSTLTGDDLVRFLQFTYELVAEAIRYLAPPDSGAWDAFRSTGNSPQAEGWEPVNLTPSQLRDEMDVDQADIEALAAIAGRLKTPNEVTALSRFDRGIIAAADAEALAQREAGARVGDLAPFREQPGSADGGADGEDVRRAPVRPARGTRSSGGVRRR